MLKPRQVDENSDSDSGLARRLQARLDKEESTRRREQSRRDALLAAALAEDSPSDSDLDSVVVGGKKGVVPKARPEARRSKPGRKKRLRRLAGVVSDSSSDDDDDNDGNSNSRKREMEIRKRQEQRKRPRQGHGNQKGGEMVEPENDNDDGDDDDDDDDDDSDASGEERESVQSVMARCEALAKRIRARVSQCGLVDSSPSSSSSSSSSSNRDDDQDDGELHITQIATKKAGGDSNGDAFALVTSEQAESMMGNGLKLKDYQLVGVNWMHLLYTENINGALCDEMGLGKTVQSLTLLGLLRGLHGIEGPHLVVAPASTLENWRRECNRWLPDARVCLYHGSQANRSELQRTMGSGRGRGRAKFDILIVPYTYFERQTCSADRAFFHRFFFHYCIYDEAHAIKSIGSARYKRLIKLRTRRRLLLTGTPVQNNLHELLALMSFCLPDVFDASNPHLLELFNTTATTGGGGGANEDDASTKRIRRALAPFILRRRKIDVLSQLSPKTERLEIIPLEPTTQRGVYDGIVQRYRERNSGISSASTSVSASAVSNLSAAEVKSVFSELRKAANHPLLVRHRFGAVDDVTGVDRRMERVVDLLHRVGAFGQEATREMIEREVADYSDWDLHGLVTSMGSRSSQLAEMELKEEELWKSAKCVLLRDLLPRLVRDEGRRVLLFSQWTSILDILERVLDSLQIGFVRFDGGTTVGDRQQIVDSFQKDEPPFQRPVFLLSTRAGGMGINLTAADTVILHDLDWNPSIDRQAEDRCHRIGQTKPVTVIKLVAEDTVDENILRIQQRKSKLDERVLICDTVGGNGRSRGRGRGKQTADAHHSDADNVEGSSMQSILASLLK